MNNGFRHCHTTVATAVAVRSAAQASQAWGATLRVGLDQEQPGPLTLSVVAEQSMYERLGELDRRRQEALHAGGEAAVERQRSRGKMTARERIDYLLDPGSFQEIDMLARSRAAGMADDKRAYTDGVVTGFGTVAGRRICIFSQDFTVIGGTLGEVSGEKIHKVIDLASSLGVPLIGINDGGGARVQEGVVALHYYGGIFRRNVHASGVIPQISVIMGSCAGGAVYSPAITDFVFMVQGTAQMYITGPDVVKTVTGEDVTHEELGGALTHGTKSGVASFLATDEKSCLDQVRTLLSYLPSNNLGQPELLVSDDDPERPVPELSTLVPRGAHERYDIKALLRAVLDGGELFEYHQSWALNLVCGFGRIGGRVVGVVANQPLVLGGVLDIDAAEKGARFVRTCDCFNIPLITFVDVPGFLPGTDQEHGGLARRAAKLIYAYCEATVPKVQLIVRRAYGAAYVVMGSKSLGADLAYAWPAAELAVMGPESAVEVLYAAELGGVGATRRAELVDTYRETHANPYVAAERGYIDDVIAPGETRSALHQALEMLATKRQLAPARKHGNIPL